MGISPFSFVGAMNYSACPEQHRKRLFYGLFGIAALSLAVSLIYTALGVFG